ncbi:pirin family protein [Streptomyces yerevanensis]|uniref:pirin family protein n=1 Tax=Streptomyces yerevanensis TaxID=66378 RepID=UPI000A60E01F|nr:pirin family protein [Streptomyces yerevanensis]
MMQAQQQISRRTVARIEDGTHLGPDAQVDDKSLMFSPQAPELTDPFLVLVDDLFSEPGFEWHPHRGLETVTLVLDGVLEHGDSIGNSGTLTAGDVQWMTAGRGIIHRELAFRNERAHILQLWVNLPADKKMVDSRYQDLLATGRPTIDHDGAHIDLISGAAGGLTAPALTHWPISGSVITMEPGRSLDHVLPGQDRAFFTVLAGAVSIGGRNVTARQTAWSDPLPDADAHLSVIGLRTGDGDALTKVLTFSGPPIRQPVAMGGPMVMNTRAEIEQAFRDFHTGRFGAVPRQARLQYR